MLKPLCALELKNLLGWNVYRHTGDPKTKRRWRMLAAVWTFLIGIMGFYSGAMSYGLVFLGMAEAVIPYVTAIASLMLFFIGVFQAGSTVFRREGYDMLIALPVTPREIVLARLLRFYLIFLGAAALVILPGLGVYAVLCAPGWGFYPLSLGGLLLVPLLPMSAALAVGAGITALTARMKGKNLLSALLSIAAVLAILYGSSQSYRLENLTTEAIQALSGTVLTVLGKLCPPALWLGSALTRKVFLPWLVFAGVSLAVFALAAGILSAMFRQICQALFRVTAKHDYRLERLNASSPIISLVSREFRRYFASSIYVVNTILGPILATVLSGAMLVSRDTIVSLPLPVDLKAVIPFLFSGVFCLMNTTSVSLSMEGKSFWIVKSLPLPTETILDGKLLMNLILDLPFYLLSEIFLLLAWKPTGLDALFFILLPGAMILFSCALGLFVNLRLPLLNWENEVSVVKQSASAALGGMGGTLLSILCAAASIAVPKHLAIPLKAGILTLILLAFGAIYVSNSRRNL